MDGTSVLTGANDAQAAGVRRLRGHEGGPMNTTNRRTESKGQTAEHQKQGHLLGDVREGYADLADRGVRPQCVLC